MNDRKKTEPVAKPAGIKLGDIYYVLFKHKWKIIVLSLLGFIASGVIYFGKKPLWGSEAELLVKYVVDARPVGLSVGDIKNTDPRGDNILNSEVRIVTSYDLATNVVNVIGAERILAMDGGGNDPVRAAKTIRKNIIVEPIRRTDVLRIAFEHPDRELVQPVLQQLILTYLDRHKDIHSLLNNSDLAISAQLSSLSNQLVLSGEALRQAKAQAGVLDINEALKSYTDQIGKKQEDISNAEAELAGHQGALSEFSGRVVSTTDTVTNPPVVVPGAVVNDYKNLSEQLDLFLEKRKELRRQFREDSIPVTEVQVEIEKLQHKKNSLEDSFPSLATMGLNMPVASSSGQPAAPNSFDPVNEAAQVRALKAKIEMMTGQLASLKTEAARVEQMSSTVADLQRKKEAQEAEYRSFETSLREARFKAAMEAAKQSNITCYEQPTPPFKDADKIQKMAMVAALGGLGLGLVIAFLLELFLDQSVKQPAEVEGKLNLPLFMSIPDTAQPGFHLPGPKKSQSRLLLKGPDGAPPAGKTNGAGSENHLPVALWDDSHTLRPFFEALRDRLFTYFDANNLKHNPKLVAVTACDEGAGVSTIAAGLAATLSETGDGNVLLVDMNNGQGAARPFFKGKPAVGLEEALEDGKRDDAQVDEHLFVASEGLDGDDANGALPRQFNHLMPKLKASDYDYIIFDMPPVSQISVTSKLARLMDINLLVVESEKTNRDIVKQASAMISATKPNLGVVLNRKRTYVPRWLLQEL